MNKRAMNEKERRAVRRTKKSLLRDVNPKDICPYLYHKGMLRDKHNEELCDVTSTATIRRRLCKRFIKIITSRHSKCTFGGLLDALRHREAYPFIAEELVANLGQETESPESDEIVTDDAINIQVSDADQPRGYQLYLDIHTVHHLTDRRARVVALTHECKRICHQGDMDKLRIVTEEIIIAFDTASTSMKHGELADRKFVAVEALMTAGRVKYNVSQYKRYLDEMYEVSMYTSDTSVSSMTYFARRGSYFAMNGDLDEALDNSRIAQQKANSGVPPGLERGMVCYIQLNQLMQKFEEKPTENLRKQILKTSKMAIDQFQGEPDDIRLDYVRMLWLKQAFCYLGIGLFGNRLEWAKPSAEDMRAAKLIIDFIEQPENWEGLESRRLMLFNVAKSMFYRHQGNGHLALLHGKEAKKIATKHQWNKELPNIVAHVQELEASCIDNT